MTSQVPWIDLTEQEYGEAWDRFEEKFTFQTAPRPEHWPAIQEPGDSVTFDLSPVFDGDRARFAAGNDAVNAEVIRAFVWLCQPDDRLLLLDWQHPSFWLLPHLQAISDGAPPVEPFPNGDYYAWLAEDMAFGTFGHPWEQTLCVFGQSLVDVLEPVFRSWLPVKRRGGIA